MALQPIEKLLYRTLLRLAKKLDYLHLPKLISVARPKSFYNKSRKSVCEIPQPADAHEKVREFNEGEHYKPQTDPTLPHKSLSKYIRKVFREQEKNFDIVFPLIKLLNESLYICQSMCQSDLLVTRERYKRKLNLQLEIIKDVENFDEAFNGYILLAHPVSLLKQPTLVNSVIILMENGKQMVEGVILNNPTIGVVGDHKRTGWKAKNLPIYSGGDIQNNFLIVHQEQDLAGEQVVNLKISPFSEIPKIEGRILAREANSDDFHFFKGLCAWSPDQLRHELNRNIWFLCKTPDLSVLMNRDSTVDLYEECFQALGGEFENFHALRGNTQPILDRILKENIYVEELWKQSVQRTKAKGSYIP